MEKPCEICYRETEYREVEKVLCSPLCQLFSRLNLSGLGKPSFIQDDDETWRIISDSIEVLTREENAELASVLTTYFTRKLVEFDAQTDYLHNILHQRKFTIELEGLESEMEQAQQSFNTSQSLNSDIFSDIRDVNEYFNEYSFRVNETRSTILSLVEKRMGIVARMDQIEERLAELSVVVGRNPDNESIYNSDLVQEIFGLNQKKADLLTFFSTLNLYGIANTTSDEEFIEEEPVQRARVEVVPGMTEEQRDLFEEVEEKIKHHEDSVMPVLKKTGNLFIKEYILGCDVIMHLPLATILDKMNDTDDTYIRNLFEIGTGRGSTDQLERAGWETKIFDSPEYDAFKPHEKVKYGTVNLSRSKRGMESLSHQYGKSYLILNPDVKSRCTFSRNDSSSDSVTGPHDLGTVRFMANLTTKFTNEEKRNMERRESYKKPPTIDVQILEKSYDYMEVQIHGELTFERDVAMIMIDKHIFNPGLKDSLKTLFSNIGKKIPYQTF